MDTYCGVRSSRPARLFSFGLLDVLLRVRLRRPQLRGATAGFGLRRLATASMNNQGCRHRFLLRADAGVLFLNVTSVSHARSNSATVQACAMHPRGVKGGSPSKTSLRVPSPCDWRWRIIGSRKDCARTGSRYTLRCAVTNGPRSQPQTVPW